jgi:hypothetical protein
VSNTQSVEQFVLARDFPLVRVIGGTTSFRASRATHTAAQTSFCNSAVGGTKAGGFFKTKGGNYAKFVAGMD